MQDILKTIGCPDTYITEVPIYSSKPVKNSLSTSSSSNPHPVIPPISSSMHLSSSSSEESRSTLKKPFKSISAEIGFVRPLNLNEALKETETRSAAIRTVLRNNQEKRPAAGLKELFDDWDPTANLETPGTSSEIPTDPTLSSDGFLKVPKEEVLDETDEIVKQTGASFDLNDSVLANEQERSIIEDLLRQQNSSGAQKLENEESPLISTKGRKKNGDESEIQNMNYVITCNYPGCGLQYNWRVKYGKLRLLDHALTHSDRKIPCKLCGFECTNVRRMRSHYAKVHPNERVEGYGMKALVSGDYGSKTSDGADVADAEQQFSDDELKELWNSCYSESIHLVGHATGFVEGDKYRRMTKRRKLEREAMNSISYLF